MPKPTNIAKYRKRGKNKNILAGGKARHRKGGDDNNRWMTPAAILEAVLAAFGGVIDLDPSTEPWNPTGAVRFFTQANSGLAKPWPPVRIWLNPEYSPIEPWIDHALEAERAGARIYMLVPVRTDAAYHHRLMAAATDVLFLKGRVKFMRLDGSSSGSPAFASMIVGLGISTRRLKLAGIVYVPTHLSEAA